MDWGSLLNIGTNLVGALAGGAAAKKAAKATQQGTTYAANLLRDNFNTVRTDLTPFRTAGTNALDWLTKLNTPGAVSPDVVHNYVTNLPGYQFASDELNRSLTNRQAALGTRRDGSAVKEGARWTNDYLVQPTYNNWLSRLSSLAGSGQQAAGTLANFGTNNASALGQLGMQGAEAGAGGDIGTMNAWTNALKNVAGMVANKPATDAYTRYLNSLAGG
mgnify:CR=1 FL=1